MSEGKSKKTAMGRRGFFGAMATAATATGFAGRARPAVAEEVGDERTKVRYRETEHVKAFYRTNRYYKGG